MIAKEGIIFSVLVILISLHQVVGTDLLTGTPPAVIYAFTGETVKFKWNYTVENKTLDFGYYASSPVWYYYNNTDINKSIIAVDDGLHDWKWTISYSTCPARLLYPTVRVRKESVATLVISNVTKEDAGFYEICVVLRTSPSIISKSLLVVKDKASPFSKVPPSTMFVTSGKTARIEWNYTFDDRDIEFQSESPVWGYVDKNNQWAIIATEKKNQAWRRFFNTTTCPQRLLNPKRVYIESQ